MFAEVVSTLLCQVKRRFPVAVVELYGTLDDSSAAGGMVALRERLAEQPVGLVLDATHLHIVGTTAVRALIDLAHQAARWPRTRIALCAAGSRVQGMVTQAGGPDGPDLYPSAEEAVAAALRRPVPPRQSVRLPPDRRAPATARALAAGACRQWGHDRYRDLVEVIVSELVTNAVTHARTTLELTVRLVDGALSLAVRDGDPRLLAEAGGGVAADGHGYGRGLLIVDAMADAWGCVPTGDGKVVWAYVGTANPTGDSPARGTGGDRSAGRGARNRRPDGHGSPPGTPPPRGPSAPGREPDGCVRAPEPLSAFGIAEDGPASPAGE